MNLTEEQLKVIEDFSEKLMSVESMAIVLQVNFKNLKKEIQNKDSGAYLSYQKGRITTIYKVRENLIKTAQMGSPQAINKVLELLNEMI